MTRRRGGRIKRIFLILLGALVVLVLVLTASAYLLLRASLPNLDGTIRTADLAAPVSVERDALGVATLSGASRNDVIWALGFVHAQERYFSMDLLRRSAAGEMAELFGPMMMPLDRDRRVFRARARAERALQALPADQLAEIQAYRKGVNAGLAGLGARPWEYWLFRSEPAKWSDADCLLVIHAMFFELNDATNSRELAFARVNATLGSSVYRFLSAPGGSLDAPLTGAAMSDPALPASSDIDLREKAGRPRQTNISTPTEAKLAGSNAFAVGGDLTSTHAALVANDMHLPLRVPNIWYRARLRYPKTPGTSGDDVDVVGITLPGVSLMVAGSNRHVAWGLTNSFGDWMDWVRIESPAGDEDHYRGASGLSPIETSEEVIKVRGGSDEKLVVRSTQWGPIMRKDADGTPLALAWTALLPDSVNLNFARLDNAQSAKQACDIANGSGIPAQNFIVGDHDGNIAWTIAGRIPNRHGEYDPLLPADWSRPDTGWSGWLAPADYPRVMNPSNSRLWSANARAIGREESGYARLGDGGYDLGVRAAQIRDDLNAKSQFEPGDFLSIQLDDRAVVLQYWRDTLLNVLSSAGSDAHFAEMKAQVERWDGSADIQSVGYRLIREFRLQVTNIVIGGFVGAGRDTSPDFSLPYLPQAEIMVREILSAKPAHLLSAEFSTWQDVLKKSANDVYTQLSSQPGGLGARTWGEQNTTHIRHFMSPALPMLGWLLDMPSQPLSGDLGVPHVQMSDFGASERFAVEPGFEEKGYMHMPGGQSDNPLSPFFGAGHRDWAEGKPAPFLPGSSQFTLKIIADGHDG